VRRRIAAPERRGQLRAALALMHNVVGGMGLVYEHLTDLGV
jgi:hypothetical protein